MCHLSIVLPLTCCTSHLVSFDKQICTPEVEFVHVDVTLSELLSVISLSSSLLSPFLPLNIMNASHRITVEARHEYQSVFIAFHGVSLPFSDWKVEGEHYSHSSRWV